LQRGNCKEAVVREAVISINTFHGIDMGSRSRFSKKFNITLAGKDSAKEIRNFIEDADHIDSSTDLSTASPDLRHGIKQRLKKDSSS
tara:strand:+ start:294 stop:554 length:261 start_codon:yes stop_codon:yes gene_type:complete